jgi:lipopolysaccharide biosynthesis glycosyltransferase
MMNNKKTKKRIVIVLASDNNYAVQMGVTLFSVLANLDEETHCSAYLLLSGDFSDENRKRIEKIGVNAKNCDINFIDMKDTFSSAKVAEGHTHLTTACYYRLSLPRILQDVDKCLYLDVDTVAIEDIFELYDTDVSDYYVAGVKAAAYHWPTGLENCHIHRLGISGIDTYFNSGVTLMNLDKMRADGLETIFEELVPQNFSEEDQDILNVACFGKIKILPFKYNVMTKYHVTDESSYEDIPAVSVCYSKEEWDVARSKPVIIHYADKLKPWTRLDTEFSEIWWRYFLDCYDEKELYLQMLDQAIGALRIWTRDATASISQRDSLILQKDSAIRQMSQHVKSLQNQVKKKDGKIKAIESSTSYRVGKYITYLPGRMKKAFLGDTKQ